MIFLAACLQASTSFGMGMLAAPMVAIRGWAPKPVRLNLISAGAALGIMGTATSIGGLPPMALAALQP